MWNGDARRNLVNDHRRNMTLVRTVLVTHQRVVYFLYFASFPLLNLRFVHLHHRVHHTAEAGAFGVKSVVEVVFA